MTTEAANYVYNLDNATLAASLAAYRREVKGRHVPSVKSFKSIAAYMGTRQYYHAKHGLVCVDETIKQIAQATDYKKDAVSDILRFMNTVGLMKTIKHGGGRNKLPTVRVLVTDGANSEPTSNEQTERTLEHTGERVEHTGRGDKLTGKLPRTPRVTKNNQEFTNGATPLSTLRAGDVATESINSILAREPSPIPDEVREQFRQFRERLNRPPRNSDAQT
jgi:hypothetical protein